MSFGYKTAWFAIRTADVDAVVKVLALKNVRTESAQRAIDAAYESRNGEDNVFISAPFDGWTLVMSRDFLDLGDGEPPAFIDALRRLSAQLQTEAQFFLTYRVIEAHAWACAVNGVLQRAYGAFEDRCIDLGAPMPAETSLGHRFFDPTSPDATTSAYWDQEGLRLADEQDVIDVARLWSVDPSTLQDLPDGLLADWQSPAARLVQPPPPRKPWWQIW